MTDQTYGRMVQVLRRAKKIRHAKENRLLTGLSFACIILLGSIGGTIGIMTSIMPQDNIVVSTYGAVLLRSGAGAYVLVGLLAFVAGVVVTALCIRSQRKNKRAHSNRNKDKESNENDPDAD